MFEEPFRFVEAIANRREYIESQIASGSPIAAFSYAGGILLFTLGRERQKIFEIYDRIAVGVIGHPGDIERLRMTAIELASTEGFTRSAGDVSLRRMANYSLSPALKAAFEQVYGPPYLARMLFVELGAEPAQNTFLRIDYDGAIQTNGTSFSRTRLQYAALSGTRPSAEQMERFLAREHKPDLSLEDALRLALDTWAAGYLGMDPEKDAKGAKGEIPATEKLRACGQEQLKDSTVEAAVLEAGSASNITYRTLTEAELSPLLAANA
jgi:proteasome alpha subunit